MEGPPRVFPLIKMSVKSLPGNQDSTEPPTPLSHIIPQPQAPLMHTHTPDIIKKAGQSMLYVCVWFYVYVQACCSV